MKKTPVIILLVVVSATSSHINNTKSFAGLNAAPIAEQAQDCQGKTILTGYHSNVGHAGVHTPKPPLGPYTPESSSGQAVRDSRQAYITPAISGQPWTGSLLTDTLSTYTVIKAKGKIRNTSTKEWLKPLSQFSGKDTLSFDTKDARLALIGQDKKTYIAGPRSDLASYILKPVTSRFGTRPGKILNYISFQRYLAGQELLILGGRLAIEVGGEEFPMDEQHFFYIRYSWRGETINKRLRHSGDKLIIDKEELYKVDEKPITQSEVAGYVLYYYDAGEQTSLKINEFTPVFPDERALKEELRAIISAFSPPATEKIKSAVEDYLFDQYGVPEKANLNEWLEANFSF
ncbi:MAG: hypothetical protein J5I98_11675 [Phaeodactylibacter sp.]|nr:hypothetical protein [Phaeodactylibacter sp.]